MLNRFFPMLGALFAVAASPAYAAPDSFSDVFWQYRASTGFDYSSGNYGAAKPTEIWYVPVSFKASKGPWALKVTTGWLSVSGPALLVDAGTADAALGLRTTGSASGVADLNFYVTYSVDSLATHNIFLDLTARLKAPTASFAKGLGTGEWDEAVQVDISSVFGDFMPFAYVGYKVAGRPQGFSLRNVVYGEVGAQYAWNEWLTTGVMYDVRQASIRTAETPQEATGYVALKISQKWSATIYAGAGFSTNSPSAGGGMTFTYKMP